MSRFLTPLFILLMSFTFLGCDKLKLKDEEEGRFSGIKSDSPEYTAVKFFDHLYHDKNMNGVLALSSPNLSRLLKSYQTNRNVQRHVVNLSYDNVEIRPDGGSRFGRDQFSKNATITVFFTGYYFEDKIEDLRKIDLVRIDEEWKVEKIYPDKYL